MPNDRPVINIDNGLPVIGQSAGDSGGLLRNIRAQVLDLGGYGAGVGSQIIRQPTYSVQNSVTGAGAGPFGILALTMPAGPTKALIHRVELAFSALAAPVICSLDLLSAASGGNPLTPRPYDTSFAAAVMTVLDAPTTYTRTGTYRQLPTLVTLQIASFVFGDAMGASLPTVRPGEIAGIKLNSTTAAGGAYLYNVEWTEVPV